MSAANPSRVVIDISDESTQPPLEPLVDWESVATQVQTTVSVDNSVAQQAILKPTPAPTKRSTLLVHSRADAPSVFERRREELRRHRLFERAERERKARNEQLLASKRTRRREREVFSDSLSRDLSQSFIVDRSAPPVTKRPLVTTSVPLQVVQAQAPKPALVSVSTAHNHYYHSGNKRATTRTRALPVTLFSFSDDFATGSVPIVDQVAPETTPRASGTTRTTKLPSPPFWDAYVKREKKEWTPTELCTSWEQTSQWGTRAMRCAICSLNADINDLTPHRIETNDIEWVHPICRQILEPQPWCSLLSQRMVELTAIERWLAANEPEVPEPIHACLRQWLVHPQLLQAVFDNIGMSTNILVELCTTKQLKQPTAQVQAVDTARAKTHVSTTLFRQPDALGKMTAPPLSQISSSDTDLCARCKQSLFSTARPMYDTPRGCFSWWAPPGDESDEETDPAMEVKDEKQEPPRHAAISTYEEEQARFYSRWAGEQPIGRHGHLPTLADRPVTTPVARTQPATRTSHQPMAESTPWSVQIIDNSVRAGWSMVHPQCSDTVSWWTPWSFMFREAVALQKKVHAHHEQWQHRLLDESRPLSERLVSIVYRLWYYFRRFEHMLSIAGRDNVALPERVRETKLQYRDAQLAFLQLIPCDEKPPVVVPTDSTNVTVMLSEQGRQRHAMYEARQAYLDRFYPPIQYNTQRHHTTVTTSTLAVPLQLSRKRKR